MDFDEKELKLLEEYRKNKDTEILTIMFTDVKDFTKITETKGDDYSSLVRKYHDEILWSEIEKNQGKVIKTIGDAFLAVFSSSSKAVETALKIQEKLKKFNEEHLDFEDINVRIGIHMGEVTLEKKVSSDIFGRHVNRAARIESATEAGHIYISYSVYDNAKSHFLDENIKFHHHGKYLLKGIKEYIDIYEVYDKRLIKKIDKPKNLKKKSDFSSLLRISIAVFIFSFTFLMLINFILEKNKVYNLEVVLNQDGYIKINGKEKIKLDKYSKFKLENLKKIIFVEAGTEKKKIKKFIFLTKETNKMEFFNIDKKDLPVNNMILIEKGKNNITEVEKDFYISKYEISQDEYLAIMNENPSHKYYGLGENLPVNKVDFYDVIEFCNKLSKIEDLEEVYEIKKNINSYEEKYFNKQDEKKWMIKENKEKNAYRLPSKNEWLFVASGGIKSKNYKYSGGNNIEDLANYYIKNQDKEIKFIDVRDKSQNELGLHNMTGNIDEWVFSEEYINDIIARPHLGGSLNDYQDKLDLEKQVNKTPYHQGVKDKLIGFRIARNK